MRLQNDNPDARLRNLFDIYFLKYNDKLTNCHTWWTGYKAPLSLAIIENTINIIAKIVKIYYC